MSRLLSRRAGGPVTISPSAMPVGNLPGWTQIYTEDFLTDEPIGAFTPKASGSDAGALNAGGAADAAYGTSLNVYPSGYGASSNGVSRPEKVLDVQDSCLRYNFSVDSGTGEAMAATVHPNIGSGYYTTYGRYSVRFKVVNGANITDWGGVIQLISSSTNWSANHGELDICEGSLGRGMQTNWHPYEAANTHTQWGVQPWGTDWHIATAEWTSTRETVYIDGVKIGETLNDRVAQDPRSYLIQTGVNSTPDAGATGQLLVDWVVAYAVGP